MNYKAVILDIDGTLMNFNQPYVSEATLKTIAALREQGVKVVIATGRGPFRATTEILTGLQYDHLVCVNGACVLDTDGSVLFSNSLSEEQIYELYDYLKAHDGTLTLTLNITNTGTREGKEVVQLYIGDDKATVLRPVKELKGFEKIALAPGETKQVTFTITPDMLKYWSEEAHDWVAETGKFTAYIGSSSTDIRGKVTFSY